MADQKKHASSYFDIPDVSLFLEGNNFTGSENTFNFRISPDGDKLVSSVWYGMKCYELSEITDTHEEEKNADGLTALIHHIDGEYNKYVKLVESGEVQGRRTYKPAKND